MLTNPIQNYFFLFNNHDNFLFLLCRLDHIAQNKYLNSIGIQNRKYMHVIIVINIVTLENRNIIFK